MLLLTWKILFRVHATSNWLCSTHNVICQNHLYTPNNPNYFNNMFSSGGAISWALSMQGQPSLSSKCWRHSSSDSACCFCLSSHLLCPFFLLISFFIGQNWILAWLCMTHCKSLLKKGSSIWLNGKMKWLAGYSYKTKAQSRSLVFWDNTSIVH